jgi:O-antigen ligase
VQIAGERRIAALEMPEVWIVIAIGLVFVAATAWSMLMHPPPPHVAYDYTAMEFRYFAKNLVIFFFFVAFVRTPRDILAAVGVLLIVILFFAWDVLHLLEGGPYEARAQSMGIADQNRLGALAVWGTALCWSLHALGTDRRWKRLAAVPLVVLPFVALLTGSRSALLQLLVLAGLILLQQRHWSPAGRVRTVALGVAIAAVILAAVPSALLLRATSFGTNTTDIAAESTRNREQAVREGFAMAAEHPFLGVGPGNFRWRRGTGAGPHNSYIWALTSGGPALLILYLFLLHRAYRAAAAAGRAGPPQLLWVATGVRFCVIELVLFSASADVWLQPPLYFLVGLSVALHRHAGVPAVAAGDIAVVPAMSRAA